jgi:hypothetical protein
LAFSWQLQLRKTREGTAGSETDFISGHGTRHENGGLFPLRAFCIGGSHRPSSFALYLPRERRSIMSRRTIISVCASALLGIGCLAMISSDASAYRGYRGGVHRAGVYHGGAYRGAAYRGAYRAGVYRGAAVRRGVAVGVGAAAVGAAAYGAYGAYRCGYYPYQPCY